MSYTAWATKDWRNSPDTTTPIDADSLEDIENRAKNAFAQKVPAAYIQFVTTVGSDSNDGLSWGTAKLTIQAAIDACEAEGGGIVWVSGDTYTLTAALTITQPIILQGVSPTATSIEMTTGTHDLIQIAADNVTIQDMRLRHTGTPTGGSAIVLQSGGYATVQRCRIKQYNGILCESGYGFSILNNYIIDCPNDSIVVEDISSPDRGDQQIIGNTIDNGAGTGQACIRYKSGGGLKCLGNKLLNHQYGLDLQVTDGSTTSVLTFCGNSVEAQRVSHIRLGRAGTTGVFSYVDITGNQMNGVAGSGTVTEGIRIDPGVSKIQIGSNVMFGSSTGIGIRAAGGDDINISGNTLSGSAATSNTAIQIDSGATDVGWYGNKIRAYKNWYSDLSSDASTKHVTHWEARRILGSISSTASYTNLFQVDLPSFKGAELEVTLTGTVNSGINGFSQKHHKLMHRGGGALTLTDVFTAVTAGPAVDVQFDTATTSGSVIIGVKRNAGDGGTSIVGSLWIRCRGNVSKLIQS